MSISVQKRTDIRVAGNTLDGFVIGRFSDGICQIAVPENMSGCSVQVDRLIDSVGVVSTSVFSFVEKKKRNRRYCVLGRSAIKQHGTSSVS